MNIEQPGTETLNQAVAVFRDTICNEKNGLQIEIKAVEPAINNVYRYDVL
jgi:hypothetical protein